MNESFSVMLSADGKKNSLGRVNDVLSIVFHDPSRLEELYETITHNDNAWVRMRAVDAFEKICRKHPEWIKPYITRTQEELVLSTQPSIQWHIAQIYDQVELNEIQKTKAVSWLKNTLDNVQVDWIVSVNCMKTLAHFVRNGDASKSDLVARLTIQQHHKSHAVVKKTQKLLAEFSQEPKS